MSLPARILKARKLDERPRRVIGAEAWPPPDLPQNPEAPASASGASLLSPRYPTAIDARPTITDNQTPLSGIWHNYLALMLEACMSELGTYPEMQGSLMDYLGVQFGTTVSNWRSFQKTYGGNEAGQLFGFIKRGHSATVAGYANAQSGSAATHQGHHPSGKTPVLFAEVVGTGISPAAMVAGIGGGVRGEVTGILGASIQYTFRGCPADDAPGVPSGSHVQPVNILLAFLVEAP